MGLVAAGVMGFRVRGIMWVVACYPKLMALTAVFIEPVIPNLARQIMAMAGPLVLDRKSVV